MVEGNGNLENQKEVRNMDNITKALQDLANAIENQTAVQSVKITITLKAQASKATKPDDK